MSSPGRAAVPKQQKPECSQLEPLLGILELPNTAEIVEASLAGSIILAGILFIPYELGSHRLWPISLEMVVEGCVLAEIPFFRNNAWETSIRC